MVGCFRHKLFEQRPELRLKFSSSLSCSSSSRGSLAAHVAQAIGQYRTKPLKLGEGVETGWRAPHGGEGTVRLSSKGESDRITQRSAVQIRPPRNHERHCRRAVGRTLLLGEVAMRDMATF